MAAKVKTLDDFKNTHDKNTIIPNRIKSGIAALGVNGWEYYGDFLKANKISVTDGSKFVETFKDFVVEVEKKRIICGSKKLASKMKEMV